MIRVAIHGHIKSYPGTFKEENQGKSLALIVGRELNDWKIIKSRDAAINAKKEEIMRAAASQIGETLLFDYDQSVIDEYVLPGEAPCSNSVKFSWTNLNGVAMKIAEAAISIGADTKQLGQNFARRVNSNGGSPLIFADVSSIGLPAALKSKRQYRETQDELFEIHCNEIISNLEELDAINRISLVLCVGADEEYQKSRVKILSSSFRRSSGFGGEIVEDFPFLYNFRAGGPAGFYEELKRNHKEAHKSLCAIMKDWQ